MSTAGQNTFRGINTQAKSALLLFLMRLGNADFDSVTLEDKEWEDFTLNFKSGKKIICETKDWSKPLSWADVKNILNKILSRKSKINPADEVIIVCKSTSPPELEARIKYLKYGDSPLVTKVYNDKGFSDDQIKLLSKTTFFKIESDLYKEALTYLYDQVTYWIPKKEVEMLLDSILVKEIYLKSEKGAIFTRAELKQKIEDYKEHKIKGSYSYDPERKTIEEQLKIILTGLDDHNYRALILDDVALTSLTAQPENMSYLLNKVEDYKEVNLEKMDKLWVSLTKRLYIFPMIRIFEKNLGRRDNANYIISLLSKNYEKLSSPLEDLFNQEFALEMVKKILDNYPDLSDNVFDLIKGILDERGKLYTRSETKRNYERERDLISELLQKVFDIYESLKNREGLEEIVDRINQHFDLIADDDKFVFLTPAPIFVILRDFINLDFENHFNNIKNIIINQHQTSHIYKDKFNGWDWMGNGISQMGKEFSISDRHFVLTTLEQPLKKYLHDNPEKAWKFILENCITRKEENVSKDKPDFLNRTVIDILIDEYSKKTHKKEAFKILSDFIKMRKGIPHKTELIFQSVRNNKSLSDQDKWNLVQEQLNYKLYKGLPANVFVEQIIGYLAKQGNKEAIKILSNWAIDPEYNKRHLLDSTLIDNVLDLLENKKTFDDGVKILSDYLTTEDFIKKTDTFDTYDIAKNLVRVLEIDAEKGLVLLKKINESKDLTINQQIVICSTLSKIAVHRPELLVKTYNEFLKPVLKELKNDTRAIEKRFSYRYARESLVQFAEHLAEADKFNESLELIKIFINDSDPPKDGSNYPDDKDGSYNHHQRIIKGEVDFTISTSRGFCAWVLQKFVGAEGKDFIKEVIPLVEQLIKDPNYYVREQACVPLIELVKNRHKVMPNNSKERFVPLELAEKIEEVAFDALTSKENQKLRSVMKHLAMVFSRVRNLDTQRAKLVLNTFISSGFNDAIEEISSLLVFYAEFRKDAFKDWAWGSLGQFEDKPFKGILENLLKTGSTEVKSHLGWQFNRLPEEVGKSANKSKEGLTVNQAIKIAGYYLEILTSNYDQKVFSNIYRFVEDYMDADFDLCFNLWIKCLEKESQFLKKTSTKEELTEMSWFPFHYNGKILLKILERKGQAEFLKWLRFLAEYPEGVSVGLDFHKAVEKLINFPKNREIKEIFDILINKRSVNFYDLKQKWLGANQKS